MPHVTNKSHYIIYFTLGLIASFCVNGAHAQVLTHFDCYGEGWIKAKNDRSYYDEKMSYIVDAKKKIAANKSGKDRYKFDIEGDYYILVYNNNSRITINTLNGGYTSNFSDNEYGMYLRGRCRISSPDCPYGIYRDGYNQFWCK